MCLHCLCLYMLLSPTCFLVHIYTLVAEFTVCSPSNSLPAENLSATPSRRQRHYPNRWWRVWNRFVSFYFARLQAGTLCNRISFPLTKVHLHGHPTKDKTSRHTHIKFSSSKNNLFIWWILTFWSTGFFMVSFLILLMIWNFYFLLCFCIRPNAFIHVNEPRHVFIVASTIFFYLGCLCPLYSAHPFKCSHLFMLHALKY